MKPVQEGGKAGCGGEEGELAGRREEQRDEEEKEIGHITSPSFQTLFKTFRQSLHRKCQSRRDTRRRERGMLATHR